MANERRVRADFVAGGLSVAMTAGDTTMQSNGLQDLPVIDTTTHALLALFQTDVLGRVIKKEIVRVTGHSAAAGSATVVRAQEGTTAQAWSIGDRWSMTSLSTDPIQIIADAAARPSVPYDGQFIKQVDNDQVRFWSGVTWRHVANFKILNAGSALAGSPPTVDADASPPYLIQAGTFVNVTNGSGGTGPINFPTPFPNGLLCVMAMNGDAGASDQLICGMYNANVSNFEVIAMNLSSHTRYANATLRFNWIAIGW